MKREHASWLGVFAVLVAAVFVSYWPLLFSGFWEDDHAFLKQIRPFHLRDLPEFFSPLRGWFYRPAFLVYFSLLRGAFGDNAVAFHAAGFVLHAANLTLLAALIWRLAKKERLSKFAIALTMAGLLFYPHLAAYGTAFSNSGISAVVWISSASTLLAAFFSLLCLHCWLFYLRRGKRRFYFAALMAFFAALISKEDAATLPLALLLLDAAFGAPRALKRRMGEYAPFFAVFVVYAVLDIVAYKNYGGGNVLGKVGVGGPLLVARYRLACIFLNAVLLDHWGSDALWMVAGLAAIVVWAWRYDRVAAFLWFWLCVAALPAPLMSGPHALAARFYYLPALAAVPAVVLTLASLLRRRSLASDSGSNLDSGQLFERSLVPLAIIAAMLAFPLRMKNFPIFLDIAFVWTSLSILIIIAWLKKQKGELPASLFWALILSCAASQSDIYGPEMHFVGFWTLFCVPVACLVLGFVARREGRSCAGAWLALSLSWAQPVIYWLAMGIVLVCFRVYVRAIRRSVRPVLATAR